MLTLYLREFSGWRKFVESLSFKFIDDFFYQVLAESLNFRNRFKMAQAAVANFYDQTATQIFVGVLILLNFVISALKAEVWFRRSSLEYHRRY